MHSRRTIGSSAAQAGQTPIGTGYNTSGTRTQHALARQTLALEETDTLWVCRAAERWLGGYDSLDEADMEDGFELDRVAILSWCAGAWRVAILLVDGDGRAQATIGRRDYPGEAAARTAFLAAR